MTSQEIDTADSAEYAIKEVSITHEDDVLIGTTSAVNAPAGQFAFYIFQNEKRVHTQWYSASPIVRYATKAEPGIYRIFSFLKNPEGKTVTKYSKPVFLNPIPYSIASWRKPVPEDRAILFNGSHWDFPALYFSSEQQRLFVMTTAAVDRNEMALPSFNRWTWAGAGNFPGHVLCIADPTLELDGTMKLGWYLGTAQHDATNDLCNFVLRFADELGIPQEKIVFWGSSGGGFAALALASRIEGATAVAINPQTDVLAYEIDRVVKMVKDLCFNGQNESDILQDYSPRLNMIQAWEGNQKSRTILVQNKLDLHHYNCHFKPFWTALGGHPTGGWSQGTRHYALLYEDVRGHGSESKQMIPEILQVIDANTQTTSSTIPAIDQLLT